MSLSDDSKKLSEHPAVNQLLRETVHVVRSFAEGQLAHLHEMVKIGLALSAEKNIDCLLEMIVSEARRFTNADGGTLYIRRDKENILDFSIVQNDSLGIRMGGTRGKITWPPVMLYCPDGSENHKNVSAHCALKGLAVSIPDVYEAEGFDFQGTKDFDATTGYRSRSMLVIPMRDHEDEVIGVLQLLNVRDRATGEVTPFPAHEVEIITSLASQAAIALTNMRLIKGLETLLYGFVKSIATAIDEKSPYTAGHILRVAELTEKIAQRISEKVDGPFGAICFSNDELAELKLAAWMHDVGKITTPEYVVDKATKLSTIFDRIELVSYRIEILKRDAEIYRLKAAVLAGQGALTEEVIAPAPLVEELDDALSFLAQVNEGGEFLRDEAIEKVNRLAGTKLSVNGREIPLLSDDEVENLSIRKGTLSAGERALINNHVLTTMRMLQDLQFPKKLKHVPLYAGMHHEKLDGSGYPHNLDDKALPLQARILAVADVFEALTAADRPYKKGKLLSESMRILGFMVKDGHLDGDVCDVLVESGLIQDYATTVLAERQRDAFTWNSKTYSL